MTDERLSNGMTEEEALVAFELTARDLLRLSAAGFLTKYKKGEFDPIETNPKAQAVAESIPAALRTRAGREIVSVSEPV